MKKITLKIAVFVLIAIVTLQTSAQAFDADADGYGLYNSGSPGKWKIKLRDEVGGKVLFLTVRSDLKLVYAEEMPNDNVAQLWSIEPHPTVDNMSIMYSVVPNNGFVEIDASITDVATPKVGTTDSNLGQIQLRKNSGSEPAYESNGDMPGQNQIFFRGDYAGTTWADQSSALRFGTTPVEGKIITLSTAGKDFRFKLIEAAAASVNTFATNAFVISNPVDNQLTIKGETSNVNQVTVYSVLGNKVLSQSTNNSTGDIKLNVSNLATGLYILEMTGNEGQRFTKKIIKQ